MYSISDDDECVFLVCMETDIVKDKLLSIMNCFNIKEIENLVINCESTITRMHVIVPSNLPRLPAHPLVLPAL
jgi:hypothetical protein